MTEHKSMLANDPRLRVRAWALAQVPKPGHERSSLRDHIVAYFHATKSLDAVVSALLATRPTQTAVDADVMNALKGARRLVDGEIDALLYRVLRAEDHAFARRRE